LTITYIGLISEEFPVFGQIRENGRIGQIIGDSKIQFYVENSTVTNDNGAKTVVISLFIKNLDSNPQLLNATMIHLIDSQNREYESNNSTGFPSLYLPSGDVLKWNTSYKINSAKNASKIRFIPDVSKEKFTIDLTKSLTPPDSHPISNWLTLPNKGIKIGDENLQLEVNDEKYANNKYIIDITLKNIGKTKVDIDPSSIVIKDQDGKVNPRDVLFNTDDPLMTGTLSSGEKRRGDVAFDIDNSKGNKMIIYTGHLGIPYFNTGNLSIQSISYTNGSDHNSVKIAIGSSKPENNQFYVPETITILKDEKVKWINEDNTLHTVTSGLPGESNLGSAFDSNFLAAGETFEHLFQTKGLFKYFCTLHPDMIGKVEVK
jgi:plastocyanin